MSSKYVALRDSAALQAVILCGVFVATVVAASWQYMLPKVDELAVLAILALSLAVTVLGIALTFSQMSRLAAERRLLGRLKAADLAKALAKEDSQSSVWSAKSVVLRQGRQVAAAIRAERAPAGDFRGEWRRQAVERTANYGAIQRFLASALLLLAVLGTFTGLKSALPHLSKALVSATDSEPQAAMRAANGRAVAQGTAGALGVTTALDLVANAFGANFLALIGSLTLASLGYGLARDRRALLTELDEVALSTWYPALQPDAGLSSLERAVVEMKASVSAVGRVGESMESLDRRLEAFTNTLVTTMQQMVGDVRATMQANSTAADRRQDAQLAEMIRSLALTTRALEHTSVGYEGLVKGLEERDLGVAAAAAALTDAIHPVQATSKALTSAAEQMQAVGELASSREKENQLRYQELGTALQQAAAQLERAALSQVKALSGINSELSVLRTEQQTIGERAGEAENAQLLIMQTGIERLARLVELAGQPDEPNHGVLAAIGALRTDVGQSAGALSGVLERALLQFATHGGRPEVAVTGQEKAPVVSHEQAPDLEPRMSEGVVAELRELQRLVQHAGGHIESAFHEFGERIASRIDGRPMDRRRLASANGRGKAW